ncbi:uncharacterized protein CLUP02_06969 [Colletotrichum lupini]|uniref:Uncharacterized protein n=1 Tax=Colletotrichum lupini TaxID=145971 RepID=A0A9Q8SQN0_9PEZI|nr:uncharacterized protein CLUP02_06969 [Colletotrichum lupini]UQC81483.1 hypothetical protein CLUP02_06969 [Colletotrichum lupini]
MIATHLQTVAVYCRTPRATFPRTSNPRISHLPPHLFPGRDLSHDESYWSQTIPSMREMPRSEDAVRLVGHFPCSSYSAFCLSHLEKGIIP